MLEKNLVDLVHKGEVSFIMPELKPLTPCRYGNNFKSVTFEQMFYIKGHEHFL